MTSQARSEPLCALSQSQIDLLQQSRITLKGRAQDAIRNLSGLIQGRMQMFIDHLFSRAEKILNARTNPAAATLGIGQYVNEKGGEIIRFEEKANAQLGDLLQIFYAVKELVKTNDTGFLSGQSDAAAVADHFLAAAAAKTAERRAHRNSAINH